MMCRSIRRCPFVDTVSGRAVPFQEIAANDAEDEEKYLEHHRTVLDRGLRVVTTFLPHTMSASVSVFVGAGSRYEEDRVAGVSHFIEHMLFKGTERRPTPKEISEAIEGIGGVLNAATDKELTVYWCKVPVQHFELAMDVLSDDLLNSRFEPSDVEKEREVIIEELNMVYDSPADMANLMIDEVVWPNQPLGRDTGGTRESVSAITRDDLHDYMSAHYAPSNAVVAVAGRVTPDQVLEVTRRFLGEWQPRPTMPWFPVNNGAAGPRVSLRSKRTEQANLCVAVEGLSAEHPDRYALDVLNTVFGEGMSSRLFLEIREKLGLAYDIHSYVNHFRDTGSQVVFAGVDTRKLTETIKAILGEMGKLRQGVPEEEVARAKESMKGRLLLRMEDTRAVSSWTGVQDLLRNSILTVEEVVELIDAVSVEDVTRVANHLFTNDKLRLAVVGPYRSEDRLANLLKI
jgi:predicted Zn-dependent peptidase